MVESCDVYFYQVGQRLGIDRIAHWAHLLGLGLNSGIDLDNERPGVMPSTPWKQKRFHERWYPAETLSVAIGQGYVAVTPLQMAMVAEVANNGIRYKPQFVKQIEGLDGHVFKTYPPEIEAEARSIRRCSHRARRDGDVVEAPDGTGHKDKLDNVIVCGKTGTAQVIKQAASARIAEDKLPEKYRDHAWFVAFAPKEHPQIAIACIIEHGGHGGSAAGPVVHDVMQKFFELNPPPAASGRAGNGAPQAAPARLPKVRPTASGRRESERDFDGARPPDVLPLRLDGVHAHDRARRDRAAERSKRLLGRPQPPAPSTGDAPDHLDRGGHDAMAAAAFSTIARSRATPTPSTPTVGLLMAVSLSGT